MTSNTNSPKTQQASALQHPLLVDIGVNLTSKQFRRDMADVVERAVSAGVEHLVVTGLSAELSRQAAALLERFPGRLSFTAGIHPHNVGRAQPGDIDRLRQVAKRHGAVAIGETGLDYHRNFSPVEVQKRWFADQLELAVELQLPVFLHEREAHDDFVAILREHRAGLVGGVVHCFTSSGDALDAYLDLDLHIGLTGYLCDARRGTHLIELARRIPADRLMIETDAPLLTPRDLRGAPRRNEPANLPHILRRVAEARGESLAELASTTTETARKIFGLGRG